METIKFSSIEYDPDTGTFTRNGRKAGTITKAGYVAIRVDIKIHLGHRLAWFLVYGRWPKAIHHLNGIKDDNRISNLEETTLQMHKSKHPSGLKKFARPAHKYRRLWLRGV